jgi:hypothetical protein
MLLLRRDQVAVVPVGERAFRPALEALNDGLQPRLQIARPLLIGGRAGLLGPRQGTVLLGGAGLQPCVGKPLQTRARPAASPPQRASRQWEGATSDANSIA